MKNNKGFTLIEILVVIGLIGIIASLVFIYINPKSQTDKTKDAKVKADIASIYSQAAISFSQNGNSFNNVCQRNEIKKLLNSKNVNLKGKCNSGSNFWVVTKKLISNEKYWCLDHLSNKKELEFDINENSKNC